MAGKVSKKPVKTYGDYWLYESFEREHYWLNGSIYDRIYVSSFTFLICEWYLLFATIVDAVVFLALFCVSKGYIKRKYNNENVFDNPIKLYEIGSKRFITFVLIGFIFLMPVINIGVNEFRHYQYLSHIKSLPLTEENLTGTYVSFNGDISNPEDFSESFSSRILKISLDGSYYDFILDKEGEHKESGNCQIIDNQVVFQSQDNSETFRVELKENTKLSAEMDDKFIVLNLYSENSEDGESINNDQEKLVFSGLNMGDEETKE